MNFWVPFLPLYMRDLGAGTEPRQLFWTALALSSNGVFRMIGGPLWGVLSDRYGRKPMYVRALYAATITTLIAAAATAPWHITVAMACQGLFSGFIPAAVALTSVSAPQNRLTSALGQVQGAQYAGTTLGPAAGAALAQFVDIRGAILISAVMPAIAATFVLFVVPRDRIARRAEAVAATVRSGWRRLLPRDAGLQFALGLMLYFMIFVMVDLVRTGAPAAISSLAGAAAATGATGIAFTVSGLASVVGAVGLSRFVGRPGQFRISLTIIVLVSAGAHMALGLSPTVAVFIATYGVASLARGAMLPATSTIIAASVPPERRGTAFGIAAAAQALAFIVGPMSAAWFAMISLSLGFVTLGAVLAGVALITFLCLREPAPIARSQPADEPGPTTRRAPA